MDRKLKTVYTRKDSRIAGNIPREVYFQCIWTVKDISRMVSISAAGVSLTDSEYLRDLYSYFMGFSCVREARTPEEKVMIRGEVIEHAETVLGCVRDALEEIPETYREGILENIISRKDFSLEAHANTWKKWKKEFIYELAVRLGLL